MIHQLRIYEIFERNKAAFHGRFRDHAARIMRKYGFDILTMWEAKGERRTEFVYLLAWPDENAKKAAWARFMADEEWKDIKRVTSADHGDLVGEIEDRVLVPTGYSPAAPQEEYRGRTATAGVRIRDARCRDSDAIRALTLGAYQEYAPAMPAHWDAYRRNILATLASVAPAVQIVAEQGSRIVGAVLLYPAASRGLSRSLRTAPEVRLLAVAPAARGQGIGAALMSECVRRARRSGATALTLHTNDVMRAAMRLYERQGFRRAAELDFRPAPDLTIKGYSLDLRDTTSRRRMVVRPSQKGAARRNSKKTVKTARRGRKAR